MQMQCNFGVALAPAVNALWTGYLTGYMTEHSVRYHRMSYLTALSLTLLPDK